MSHKIKDLGRRNVNLLNRRVEEALPEYFVDEYPQLVKFLKHYYDFMDSDGEHSFDNEIKQLPNIRDITETPKEYLDKIINELGSNLENGDLFTDARFTARRFADHYRNKGSRFSIEEFFQAFFQQDVEVEYPKKDVFTVGVDQIGYDSQKFIQNYARYQIFSILIKTGLGVPTYRELYKKYVHPAGFYFEGEVVAEGVANVGFNQMPISIEEDLLELQVVGEAFAIPEGIANTTGLRDSDAATFRMGVDELASKYAEVPIEQLSSYYTIQDLIDVNSPTMDESSGVVSLMSTTSETMDEDLFRRYGSDSAI